MDQHSHKKLAPGAKRPGSRIVLGAGVGTVTAIVVTLALVWYSRDIILLAFAGVLLAVFLQTVSQWLSDHTSLPYRASLAVVIVSLVALLVLITSLLGARIAEEASALAQTLPDSVDRLKLRLQETPWGQALIRELPPINELLSTSGALAQLGGVSLSALNGFVATIVVLFVGVYTAATPNIYVEGIVRLVPLERRARAREVLFILGYNLRRWLLGHLVAMTVVGVSCGLGLRVLGVPHAMVLGLFAFIAELIPYIGPIVAAIPAILLGWSQDTSMALSVLLLYCGVHFLEGYLVLPLVYQRAASLPAALTTLAVVLFGMLAGFLGAVVATPLLLVLILLVKTLYVEDVLGDKSVDVPGKDAIPLK